MVLTSVVGAQEEGGGVRQRMAEKDQRKGETPEGKTD